MVHVFMTQSGGAVGIESSPGKGTTITLYVPRSQSAKSAPATNTEADLPMGRGETILVLEDEPDVLTLAQNLLESLNYSVLLAKDTDAAKQLLTANPEIRIVLSDVVLSGNMTGPEFFKENAALVENLKVIFMSGYPVESTRVNKEIPLWSSGEILLNKPFSRSHLARQVRKALEDIE